MKGPAFAGLSTLTFLGSLGRRGLPIRRLAVACSRQRPLLALFAASGVGAGLPQVGGGSNCDLSFLVVTGPLLTYMSIRDEWQRLVADREHIFRLKPLDGDPAERTVLLTSEMNGLIEGPWEEGEAGNRLARLLATLHNIVAGRRLVVCMTPHKARKANICRLCPVTDSIWD